MRSDANLHYIYLPTAPKPESVHVDFTPVQEFLQDESQCRVLWEMLSDQFHTRSKFLAIWPSVRYVAAHRTGDDVDGLLLVSTPVNWQIDYVVVRPYARRRGIAAALVNTALNRAFQLGVPYVMLTSRPELRPLYEGACGCHVIDTRATETDFALSEVLGQEA